ncbi:hypothetical protein ACIBH1_01180 [Nonomuraea sp. NPDC050663]|uniref:hypothetical protein n=1 Tax=Nonomuraea sp. NPDC050663 TaxID=3364370 RepID=UPI00379A6B23
MRKILAAAALTGSIALTGMAVAPAAQAATAAPSTSAGSWGKYFSSDGKAYTFGNTFKKSGVVHTYWYGVDKKFGKKGYVWFWYYKNGHWFKKLYSWDGKTGKQHWSGHGIKKIYTYTCWGGSHSNCGGKHWIYK